MIKIVLHDIKAVYCCISIYRTWEGAIHPQQIELFHDSSPIHHLFTNIIESSLVPRPLPVFNDIENWEWPGDEANRICSRVNTCVVKERYALSTMVLVHDAHVLATRGGAGFNIKSAKSHTYN